MKPNESVKSTGIFQKRQGTTNKGDDYEDLLIAALAFKLANNSEVEDFHLSSNNDKFEKFDDIVINIQFGKPKTVKNYLIQAKYKNDEKKIGTEMLAAAKGKFSIQTYLESFKKIIEKDELSEDFKCILFTNLQYDLQQGTEFKLGSLNVEVKVCKVPAEENFINTADNKFVYKFQIDKDTKDFDDYQDFFEHFYLYSNQKSVEDLENCIKHEFKKTYFCKEECFTTYLNYIKNWSEQSGRKRSLDKETVKIKIGESLLKPFLNNPSTYSANIDIENFLELCLLYDIVITSKDLHFNVFNETMKESSQNISKVKRNYHVTAEDEEEENALVLWHMGRIPLVVKFDSSNQETIHQALKLFQEEKVSRKFVLIGENIDKSNLKSFKVFQNLEDLCPDEDLRKEILENTKFSLQGRTPVALDCLHLEGIRKCVSADELFRREIIPIGENKEDLPSPYIDQHLTKNVIDFEIVNDLFIKTVPVLIVGCEDMDTVKSKIRNVKVVNMEEFLLEDRNEGKDFLYTKTVIIGEDCTAEQFNKICKKSVPNACNLFYVTKQLNLDWIRSSGNNNEIRRYVRTVTLEESKIFGESYKKVNTISAKPGAGKSVMLKFLKNHIPSDYWVVAIAFRDHINFFRDMRNGEDVLWYFLDFQSKTMKYDSLTLKLRESFVRQGKVVFLWDAIDELPEEYITKAINTVQMLCRLRFTHWITMRDFLQPFVVQHFENCTSHFIKEMDPVQQGKYIEKHLKDIYKPEELSTIIEKITTIISLTRDEGFLGIPLRIHMLTDLFVKDRQKYEDLLDSLITLPEIIQYFINEKINFCYKDKGGYSFGNQCIDHALTGNTRYRIYQFEILALKSHLPKNCFEKLGLESGYLLEDFQSADAFGIIRKIDVDTGLAEFVHNVYGEYFAAKWMARNFVHVRNFKDFIFEDNYKNIRMMFDLILAAKFPAHIAVLHKDLESLRNHKSETGSKDPAGRTPLHLVCSWGKRHPLLDPRPVKDHYVLKEGKKGDAVREDSAEYKDMLKFLIDLDPFEMDKLFQWNSIQYADNTLSLGVLEILLGRDDKFKLKDLRNFQDYKSVSYYCIKFDYRNLFKVLPKVEYIVNEQNGNSLLHLAVIHQRDHLVKELFVNELYEKKINVETYEVQTLCNVLFGNMLQVEIRSNPLHLAAALGNNKIIDILLSKDAKLDFPGSVGNTALHIAASCGQVSSVETLLNRGASVNSRNQNGENILHLVTLLGNLNLIEQILQQKPQISRSKNCETVFDIATNLNRSDVLDLLVKSVFFDDNALKKEYLFGPLLNATTNGQDDIVKILVNNGADINMSTDRGITPLHCATFYGHVKIVEFLLQNRDNSNFKDDCGLDVFSYAVWGQHVEVVKLLFRFGASTTNFDVGKNNILIMSSLLHNKEIVEILLKKGVDIYHKNIDGFNALHYVFASGNIEMIRLFLKHRPDVNCPNNEGITPLHIAACMKRKDLVEVLIRNGGNINARAYGLTPLQLLKTPDLAATLFEMCSYMPIVPPLLPVLPLKFDICFKHLTYSQQRLDFQNLRR